ncbi:hypothetical protein WKW80_26920 [Variovorax humicola]|uniref:Uncharacterized protein n=1 Tax=Variovorax humicola TaxID=1769758 RepID=A0ABU8W6E8_9BURK
MTTGYFERSDFLHKWMVDEAERLIAARLGKRRPEKAVEVVEPSKEDQENAQTRLMASKLIDRMAKADKGKQYLHPGYEDEDS